MSRIKRHRKDGAVQNGMVLKEIEPKTYKQELTFDYYNRGNNLLLHGCPGTGKTFLSMYLALKDILSSEIYHKLIIIRSAQPSKHIGFLPGSENEKLSNYEIPYRSICNELFGRGDAYEILKDKGFIEFQSTSFQRGTTLDNCIILMDESQNCSYMELKTVITRVGSNSKIIISGDIYQDDLTSERYNEQSGLKEIMGILLRMPSVCKVEFTLEDIVRSGFVKEFIMAEYEIETSKIRLVS